MRIALITVPPIECETILNSDEGYGIPLGILSLSGVLEQAGVEVEIVDLYKLVEKKILKRGKNFHREVACYLASRSHTILGFTTMCYSYPVTIKIAEEYKKRVKDAIIVFGGPQATTSDRETLKTFRCVDIIVRGEGEKISLNLIKLLLSGNIDKLNTIDGITYRNGSSIVRKPSENLIQNLDLLPFPAYHLHPFTQDFKEITIEIGRSCLFACKFCATSIHWGRKSRFKTINRILEEVKYFSMKYQINHFFFLHDCATIHKRQLLNLAKRIKEENLNITWRCHGRADHLTEEELVMLKDGGLRQIFYGIESGSSRIQEYIGKNLNLKQAIKIIKKTNKLGIKCTTSFIIGFPIEEKKDVEDTLTMLLKSRMLGSHFALYLLLPLSGTALFNVYQDSLKFDGYNADIIDTRMLDFTLIKNLKDVFPFYYYFPTEHLSRDLIIAAHTLIPVLYHFFPRFSVLWKYYEKENFIKITKLWKIYCKNESSDMRENSSDINPVNLFRKEINSFLYNLYKFRKINKLTHDMLKYELALNAIVLHENFDGIKDFKGKIYWIGIFNYKISDLAIDVNERQVQLNCEEETEYLLIYKVKDKLAQDTLKNVRLSKLSYEFLNAFFKSGNLNLVSEVIKNKYGIKTPQIKRFIEKLYSADVL